jgi:hypothetical protein
MLGDGETAGTVEGEVAEPTPVASGCCCHHCGRSATHGDHRHAAGSATPASDAPRPCRHDDSGGGQCQCICGGAVVENHVAFDPADAAAILYVLPACLPAVDLTPAEVGFSAVAWPPDGMVLSGREICRLRSLMLC